MPPAVSGASLALRRSRRPSSGRASYRENDLRTSSASLSLPNSSHSNHESTNSTKRALAVTPRKTKKRVRFSDPGPSRSPSTGLTPFIRRASLSGTPRSRRPQTPSRTPRSGLASYPISPSTPSSTSRNMPDGGEVSFLPLRQVLDGRVQRRIRRNGLSEEMNRIQSDKRHRVKAVEKEVERLRKELHDRDDEIYRLQNETIVMDTDRVWELEQQINSLKQRLDPKEGDRRRHTQLSSSPIAGNESQYEWTLAARDPFASDAYSDVDVEEEGMDTHISINDGFGDATMGEIAVGTPSRKPGLSISTSFPTPPATSPGATMPNTPCSALFARLPQTPHSDTGVQVDIRTPSASTGVQANFRIPEVDAGVQADMTDPEKQLLGEQLMSMRLELAKLTGTIESYESLSSRLGAKLDEALPTNMTAPKPDLEGRLALALQSLSDRTAALLHLSSSLSGLGFPGSDASDIVINISNAFRAARLELEYLTPGEVTLPLTSAGAKTLDMLLGRLRDLAKRVKEADDSIDEYHELELSLRQQLGARVEVMDAQSRERDDLLERLASRDEAAQGLEVAVSRLRGAISGYERDIRELENLVERMERDNTQTQLELNQASEKSQSKSDAIKALEERLAMVESEAKELHEAQDEVEKRRADDVASMSRTHGATLASRDKRIAQLREEVERLSDQIVEGLHSTQQTIHSLRNENKGLESRAGKERQRAKAVVDSMKAELERVLQMSNKFLTSSEHLTADTPEEEEATEEQTHNSTPIAPAPGASLSGHPARTSGAKRRFDSGIGVDEDEDEVDELHA
ncbi:uncharacterized protein MKZ38_001368 [Zalerion maritima]|uniref:Uncharacterized protein n=1 Tax=Zalerion maritima TaxID=339359 RepID=A0AAD5WRJ4_9PEZI|nr:uncharacterized protein MKZ38_001368 [Zalerion maritima]